MIRSLITSYRSTVYRLVDDLTEEQMNAIVERAKDIVKLVECEE